MQQYVLFLPTQLSNIIIYSTTHYTNFHLTIPLYKPPQTPNQHSSPPTPPATPPAAPAKCPRDTLKLGACVDLLGGLVHLVVGTPPSSECCALIKGLADLEAALCLCTVVKANVLGINLTVPLAVSLLLSACEKTVPPGFKC
ncbi:Putative lipid-binding protein At4g00165 [Linum grandiflorum]